ncbi:hypothetical protein IM40_09350 (plasmid) [Candidatus Paracaedimonas acanthamoebae]|nr:hypothetical protein IM40_09350 [Candidatus Paracaedimonas acanthamoebae]
MNFKRFTILSIFLTLLSFLNSACGTEYSIYSFTGENEEEKKNIREICRAHTRANGKEFFKVTGDEVIAVANVYHALKKDKNIDELLGVHNFFWGSKLVGFLYVKMDYRIADATNAYAECQVLLHPKYRGQGLGTLFRKKFNEEMVNTRVGQPLKVIMARVDCQLEEHPRIINFQGVKGYIHIDNIASRKLMMRLGCIPVDLGYSKYMGSSGDNVAQILYIYPPNNAHSFLTKDIQETIMSNNTTTKPQIVEIARQRQADIEYETELTLRAGSILTQTGNFESLFTFLKDFSKEKGRMFPEGRFMRFMQYQLHANKSNRIQCEQIKNSVSRIIQSNLYYFPLFAADKNILNDEACYELAVRYRKGIADLLPLKPQYQNALLLFLPLAHKGNAKAQHNLGMLYYYQGNYTEAVKWWEESSKRGVKESKNNLVKLKKEVKL